MANDFNIADGPGTPDGADRTNRQGQLILGDDGTNLQTIQVTAAGILKASITDAAIPGAAAPTHSTLLSSSARTASTNSSDVTNTGWNSVHVIIVVTAGTGFHVRPILEAYNATAAAYYPILFGTPITTQGTFVLKLGPVPDQGLNSVIDGLPAIFRLRMVHADATSVTYSAGANLQSL